MAELDPERLPWEAQPRETQKAFAAFQVYLSLPTSERSIYAAWKAYCGDRPRQHVPGSFRRWHGEWRWDERAMAYESHLAGIRRETEEAVVREKSTDWAERQEQIRERTFALAEKAMARAEEFLKTDITPGVMTPWALQATVISLATADRLARLASGMETDRKAVDANTNGTATVVIARHDLDNRDPDAMTPEELVEYAATVLADHAHGTVPPHRAGAEEGPPPPGV